MARLRPNLLDSRVSESEIEATAEARTQEIKSVDQQDSVGLQLLPSRLVEVSKLTPSPYNAVFDDAKDEEYWDHLRRDIEETGVITDPLIAKKDGTLIAGHSRLRIAKELLEAGRTEFAKIPVLYVRSELSEEEEIRRVLLSNLLRFEIPQDVRLQLEAQAYPDYYFSHRNGRPRRDEPKRNTSTSIGKETAQSPATVRQKRRIITEASRKAEERGAGTPDVADIAAARESLNQKRRGKANASDTESEVDRTQDHSGSMTLVSLRTIVSEFCKQSVDEGVSEILEDFLGFVERRMHGSAPPQTKSVASNRVPKLTEILNPGKNPITATNHTKKG
jgi:hypothetical protein